MPRIESRYLLPNSTTVLAYFNSGLQLSPTSARELQSDSHPIQARKRVYDRSPQLESLAMCHSSLVSVILWGLRFRRDIFGRNFWCSYDLHIILKVNLNWIRHMITSSRIQVASIQRTPTLWINKQNFALTNYIPISFNFARIFSSHHNICIRAFRKEICE